MLVGVALLTLPDLRWRLRHRAPGVLDPRALVRTNELWRIVGMGLGALVLLPFVTMSGGRGAPSVVAMLLLGIAPIGLRDDPIAMWRAARRSRAADPGTTVSPPAE